MKEVRAAGECTNTEVQMNDKFFDLAREKQDRMINGAVEVFAKNGYKHASTDDMVKTVGVSKGLWFHYFGSKEGIYVFVYDYCVKYMLLELSTIVDEKETNYFDLIGRLCAVPPMFAEHSPSLVARAAQKRAIRRRYKGRALKLLNS